MRPLPRRVWRRAEGYLNALPNTCVNLTAEERCSSVPSALRAPAAGYADR
jgi:hypothetical protein